MFIVFRNGFKIYCQKSSTKKLHVYYIECIFFFNPSSLAVSTFSFLTSVFLLRLLYVPINDLAGTILESRNPIPLVYNT